MQRPGKPRTDDLAPDQLEQQRPLSLALLREAGLDAADLARNPTWEIGRYEVISPLGQGATAEVYLAQDPVIGRQVAIKVLSKQVRVSEERFRREMQVLASLKHPSIIEIFDAGVHDGRLYFVMEYAGERSLAELDLTLEEHVEALETVARACHAAHEHGIVHRDLKPENILYGDRPIVADFGVAKLQDDLGQTNPGDIVGTPSYMAPEQIDPDREIGPWTDIYALGAILYEALTGELMFTASSLAEMLIQIAHADPTPPTELAPDVDPTLARIALRALAKDPDDRHESAEAFAEDLQRWREGGRPPASLWAAVAAVCALVVIVLAALIARLASPATPSPSVAAPTGTVETPPPEVRQEIEQALARVRTWEKTPCNEGEPFSYADVERAFATVDAALEKTELPPSLAQVALLTRARAHYHLGHIDLALSDLRRARTPPGSLGDESLAFEIRVLGEEKLHRYQCGYPESARRALAKAAVVALAALGERASAEARVAQDIATGDFAQAQKALQRIVLAEGNLSPEQSLLSVQLMLRHGTHAQLEQVLSPARRRRGTAMAAHSLLVTAWLHKNLSASELSQDRRTVVPRHFRGALGAALAKLELRPSHPLAQQLFIVCWQAGISDQVNRPGLPSQPFEPADRAVALTKRESERSKTSLARVAYAAALILRWAWVSREARELEAAEQTLRKATDVAKPRRAAWITRALLCMLRAKSERKLRSQWLDEASRCLDKAATILPPEEEVPPYREYVTRLRGTK